MDIKKAVTDVKGGKIDFKVDKTESFMLLLEKHLLQQQNLRKCR